jgi:hypothetical protein
MWCWRRTKKIRQTDCKESDEVLIKVEEERNIVQTIKIRMINWICHILRVPSKIRY